MKYTIHVNQAGADAANLRGKVDIIDLAIFDAFKDFANGTKCEKKVGPDGRVWFWVSYSLIIAEIPYCGIKTNDGIYRRMKNLQAVGVIEFHPENQRTNKTFFTWGATYDLLISDSDLRMKNLTPTDEKPEGYGLKTGRGTDEKPDNHYTNNPFTNPHTKNQNNAGASDPLSPPFKKVDEIYPEQISLEAEKAEPLHRGPGAVRVSITDPEFPGVTVVEELAPGPKTRNGRKSKTQEEIDLAGRVIEYLNKAAGRNFKTNTGDNAKGIIAQSRQGYTEAQMQKVIDFKIRQWGNDVQMREHLNPVTLFRPSNFERYLSAAELPALQQAGQPKPQNFQTRSHINNAGGDLDRYNEPQIF